MQITNIVTNSISPKELGICGEFTITLDDSLCIHKIRVVNGSKGLFITFPNTGEMKRFSKAKRYADIVHPTNNSLRQYIQKEVLLKYNDEIKNLT